MTEPSDLCAPGERRRVQAMGGNQKKVVILGGFDHEGLRATLKAIGYEGVSMNLDNVRPKTWRKRAAAIQSLQDSGRLGATVIYLHTTLLLQASRAEYRDAFAAILQSATQQRTIVFVFQDNLDGVFAMRHVETREPMSLREIEEILAGRTGEENGEENDEEYDEEADEKWETIKLRRAIDRLRDYQARRQEVESLIRSLYESGAQVAPFFLRSDVTIRLQEFLDDTEQGIFLRLFVPDDRLQADQLRGFLTVLERYLRQIEHEDFSIESRKSEKGTIYVFKWNAVSGSLERLSQAFARFDDFMKLCGDNASQAESVLKGKGFSDRDAALYVDRYSKDYRRIVLDTRHEFERKMLFLKQKFESEGVDAGAPALTSPSEKLSGLVSVAAGGSGVVVNIGGISIQQAKSIQAEVNQLVNGSIEYNQNDQALMQLFSQYADSLEAVQSRSDLDQLKDQSAPEPARQNAKQRLCGFLRKAAQRAGEAAEKIAVGALTGYLESLLKGS